MSIGLILGEQYTVSYQKYGNYTVLECRVSIELELRQEWNVLSKKD